MRRRGIVLRGDLREIYPARGDYTARMGLDPARSQSVRDLSVTVRNADGLPMEFTAKRWGTKLTVCFRIDEATPDGVSVVEVSMSHGGGECRERLCFWVVKD